MDLDQLTDQQKTILKQVHMYSRDYCVTPIFPNGLTWFPRVTVPTHVTSTPEMPLSLSTALRHRAEKKAQKQSSYSFPEFGKHTRVDPLLFNDQVNLNILLSDSVVHRQTVNEMRDKTEQFVYVSLVSRDCQRLQAARLERHLPHAMAHWY